MRQVIIRIVRSATQLTALAFVEAAVPILEWVDAAGVDVDQAQILMSVQTILFAGTVAALTWAENRWVIVSRILSWNLAETSGLDGYQPRRAA
jgi:hypothetical protein